MTKPHLHSAPEPKPKSRSSFLRELKDNWVAAALTATLVSVVAFLYVGDTSRLYDGQKGLSESIAAVQKRAEERTDQLQAGVNQLLTNQGQAAQKVDDLMSRVDRDGAWMRTQITEILRKTP